MIRPDGTDHHGEVDGWADHDGKPLSIAWTASVKAQEYAGSKAIAWTKLIVDHKAFPEKAAAPLWSPVILLPDQMRRCAASVSHVTALVYDIDHGATWHDVQTVLEIFGIRYWMYTTWSHSEEQHKFRVVLGIDEAIPAADYREVWQAVRDMMQWPVDESCKDVCRLMYVPSAPEGSTPWQAFAEDGTALDWRSAVEWWRSVQTPAARTAVAIQDARAMSARISMDSKQLMDEATQDTFVWMLNQIDPDVAYHYWTRIGMIAKDLGMENEWIRWCSNGAKYSAGEPQRKLASFRR